MMPAPPHCIRRCAATEFRVVTARAARRWLAAGLAALAVGTAWAHGLSVSLQSTSQGLRGQAIYADGSPARGDAVQLLSDTEPPRELAQAVCDGEGRFQFTLPQAGAYRVVVDAEEGHRAQARLDWAPPGSGGGSPAHSAAQPQPAPDAALSAALRAELAPLREDIARLQARTQFAEVVGGVGLITGLFAALAWWRSRRRGR